MTFFKAFAAFEDLILSDILNNFDHLFLELNLSR